MPYCSDMMGLEHRHRVAFVLADDVDDDPVDRRVAPERRDVVVADRRPDLVAARQAAAGVGERHRREVRDVARADDRAVDAQLAAAGERRSSW